MAFVLPDSISLLFDGLFHGLFSLLTKIIATVTMAPYWCTKSVNKTKAPFVCMMVLCMIVAVLTEVDEIKEFTSQESLL